MSALVLSLLLNNARLLLQEFYRRRTWCKKNNKITQLLRIIDMQSMVASMLMILRAFENEGVL